MDITNQDREDIRDEALDGLFRDETGLDLFEVIDDPESHDAIAGCYFAPGTWVGGGTIAGLMLEALRAGRRLGALEGDRDLTTIPTTYSGEHLYEK